MSARNARTGSVDSRPLLSICIPTCNRADFLRVMLQALLPQVREFGDQVEVWVLDNASTDQTPQVLAESAGLGPFRVHRQSHNVGPTRNIVCGPATLATGKYVWVLGDHNLLRPGALGRLLECLMKHPEHELFYLNFRAAVFPAQWPETATGGHEGDYHYVANPEMTDGVIEHWSQLLRPFNAMCTQNYVHVIAVRIWRDCWSKVVYGQDYSSALTTYPHTMTVVNACLYQQAVVIADPVITIFNGAQSWSSPFTRVRVYLVGLPDLLRELQQKGLPAAQLHGLWTDFFAPQTAEVILGACEKLGRLQGLTLVLRNMSCDGRCWSVLLSVLHLILVPRCAAALSRFNRWCRRYRSWYLYNFRPARWYRSRRRILKLKNFVIIQKNGKSNS